MIHAAVAIFCCWYFNFVTPLCLEMRLSRQDEQPKGKIGSDEGCR